MTRIAPPCTVHTRKTSRIEPVYVRVLLKFAVQRKALCVGEDVRNGEDNGEGDHFRPVHGVEVVAWRP